MYDNLYDAMKDAGDDGVTIRINVSTSALRKGLNKIRKTANQTYAILDLPLEERIISIVENEDGTVTVALAEADTTTNRFENKFSFEIVGDSNGKEIV